MSDRPDMLDRLMKALRDICDRLFFTIIFSFFVMAGLIGLSSNFIDEASHELITELGAYFIVIVLFTWFTLGLGYLSAYLTVTVLTWMFDALDNRNKRKGIPQKIGVFDSNPSLVIDVRDFARGFNRVMLETFIFEDTAEHKEKNQ